MESVAEPIQPEPILFRSTRAARAAAVALGFNAALHVAWVALWLVVLSHVEAGGLSNDDARSARVADELLTYLSWLLQLVAAVLFFVWVARSFRSAKALGVPRLHHEASSVIAGFFIPIVNLVRPYQGLRALDAAVDPASLPEPLPEPATNELGVGYREPAQAKAPVRPRVRRPPLLSWWVLWLSQGVVAMGAFFGDGSWETAATEGLVLSVLMAMGALLAALVVLRIDARLCERARRVVALQSVAVPRM